MSQTMTEPAWQQAVADQAATIGIPDDATHLVVHVNETGSATLLSLVDSEAAGVVQAEDYATKVDGGEVTVVPVDQIRPLIKPGTDVALEPDADTGKLFDLPRVKVIVDETDPSVIKLAFSGDITLDRTLADDVAVYNKLKAGKTAELTVEAFVAGPKTTHRRDSEGDVDAVVQTKSIKITSLLRTDKL